MTWFQHVVHAALIAGITLGSGVATAAEVSASARAEAKRHYEEAKQLVKAEAFEEAATAFQRAYELAPHFEVLYNLGQCHVALGQPIQAAETLTRYLAEGGERIAVVRRAEVEKEIERQRANIGELVLSVEPASATVEIDGVAVQAPKLGSPFPVTVGRHVISVTAPGYQPKVLTVAWTKAERQAVTMELQRSPDPAPLAFAKLAVACPLADVEVWVDGEKKGISPLLESISVRPGARHVRFHRPGYSDSERQVELVANEVEALDCGLRPLQPLPPASAGRLALRISEPDAVVEVDGSPIGATGLLPFGRHRVEIRQQGFEVTRFEIVVPPGRTISREVRLVPTQQFSTDYGRRARRQRLLALAVGGTGVLAGAVGLAIYIDNDNRFDTWQTKQATLDRQWAEAGGTPRASALEAPQAANDELGQKVVARDALALGFGIAGGVLTGLGGALWLLADDPQRYGSVSWDAGTRHVAVDCRWRF